ncbi:claudin 15-like b isoform X1 [Rhinichthys klamathensis goyatoka]|uniref:claudin 15-like b isoform X1 n=1 Tax=Rhinichthys klamathensis goyatoka TaxID=3034132 RepID=UPI0024B61E8B|nr:claudin 15-like b isoform X1 [Rhinichthys klamathensis goyatoka]
MASTVFQLTGLLLGLVGWCLESSCVNSAVWRRGSHAEAVLTSSSYFEGLWMTCASNSLGAVHCQRFKTILGLPGYIQACRALMIIALVLGLLSVVLATMGLKCTKLGSTSEESKGKISLTAGVMFMLSGLCVMVAVSWYAARVVQEFNDPFYGGTKYELGVGLYLGWAAGALAILGGGILCTSFKSSAPAQTRAQSYNYSASQPQKIYRSAPSENTLSKAYV